MKATAAKTVTTVKIEYDSSIGDPSHICMPKIIIHTTANAKKANANKNDLGNKYLSIHIYPIKHTYFFTV
jgi:hypothetical protein